MIGGQHSRYRTMLRLGLLLACLGLGLAMSAPSARAAQDVCAAAFPHPVQVTTKIRFGRKTVYNQDLSRELVCSGSFGAPDGVHLSLGAQCDIIAAAYDLTDPAATDIGTVACSLASVPHGGAKAAVKDAVCGYLADAFGVGVGLFAAGASANPAIGVATWKGVTFFANTAVCVGLADGGAKTWGYKHETDHEIAVARDIVRKRGCLQLTQQRIVGVGRLNWSAIRCPIGFASHDASPFHRPIQISRSGRIGKLAIDVSAATDITRLFGPPGFTDTGNVCGGSCGYADYEVLGYGCGHSPQYGSGTTCSTNYYVSLTTGRLESFVTTSRAFALPGGVRVGVSGTAAAKREHQPDIGGCFQGIFLRTRTVDIDLWTRGGHEKRPPYIQGGKIAAIGIDDRRAGVGVLFC
jgi:hypothetical protein